jgi:hypothetical protein
MLGVVPPLRPRSMPVRNPIFILRGGRACGHGAINATYLAAAFRGFILGRPGAWSARGTLPRRSNFAGEYSPAPSTNRW